MAGPGVTELHRASKRVKQIHAEDGITFASDVKLKRRQVDTSQRDRNLDAAGTGDRLSAVSPQRMPCRSQTGAVAPFNTASYCALLTMETFAPMSNTKSIGLPARCATTCLNALDPDVLIPATSTMLIRNQLMTSSSAATMLDASTRLARDGGDVTDCGPLR